MFDPTKLAALLMQVTLPGSVLVVDVKDKDKDKNRLEQAAELEALGLIYCAKDDGLNLYYRRSNLLALLLALGATKMDFIVSGILSPLFAQKLKQRRLNPVDYNIQGHQEFLYPTENFLRGHLSSVAWNVENRNYPSSEALQDLKDMSLPSLGVAGTMHFLMSLWSLQGINEIHLLSVLGLDFVAEPRGRN